MNLQQRPDTGRPYWKALVQSIHHQDENTLLIVAWFYDPDDVYDDLVPKNLISQEYDFHLSQILVLIIFHSDLHTIDTYMGDTELIASNHLDVVDAKTVECMYFFKGHHELN